MSRLKIPRQLQREVLLEAGHRCAIPTCKQTTTEIAHIQPWAKVKKHEFDNLIALCPTCHSRYDKNEIDRVSMRRYKLNLSIINSRYGDLEKRILRYFAENPELEIPLSKSLDILLMYLLEDGLILKSDNSMYLFGDYDCYILTDKGKEFVERWLKAQLIE